MPRTIRVRAADGLKIPLPAGLGRDAGVTVITPETSVEVLYNRFTRKRIAAGDFVAEGEPAEPAELPVEPPPVEASPEAEELSERDTVPLPEGDRERRAGLFRRRREED